MAVELRSLASRMARSVRAGRPAAVSVAPTVSAWANVGPYDAARRNLEEVTDALRAADVPYLLLRVPGVRYRVAVEGAHRAAAVAAVRGTGLRARVLGVDGAGTVRADALTAPDGHGLRLFRRFAVSAELVHGADCGCDLEFWRRAADGGLHAPSGTPIGRVVPRTAQEPAWLTVGGREHPSLAAFVQRRTDEVDFPVDAVYTWVDGDDPVWRERRAAVLGDRNHHRADGGPNRYLSRDELRYSLRSIAVFAPWIRRIWIVTDGQVPAWLREAPQDGGLPHITVVDHRDVLAADVLPTYNSHAIETRLHHVDGLAEHFLYFNDDFFLGRPLRPERFFHPAGAPRCFPSSTTIPPGPAVDGDPTWIAAAKNARALVEREFGRTTACAFKHAPYPLRRTVLADLERRFAPEFDATARSRIRSRYDVAPVSALFQHHGLCSGAVVEGSLSCDTVPLGEAAGLPMLDRLLERRDRDAFCLNDLASGDMTEEEKSRAVADFLPRYLPVVAPWENDAPLR